MDGVILPRMSKPSMNLTDTTTCLDPCSVVVGHLASGCGDDDDRSAPVI
ncbi:hypothetical protein RRG08_064217 [Elysia crispata]|uniref:Uncharacterized protein n=1 Tax=Elysia crispata TaxID=231223 RepID=A0AAE0YE94_9GAST|nr:hypothetical protein RRG08_064217 [Elysia crispata]